MRKIIDMQRKFGETPVEEIEFDPDSRDEIPKLLIGLQSIYSDPGTRGEIFKILEELVPEDISADNGRPGMELWRILVLGTLRLNCNWDYDKLKEMADNHVRVREMLGISDDDRERSWPLQTLKDNVSMFTPEVADRINQVVVRAGHEAVGKGKEEVLKGRCDSFVAETDVHYPTDISLLSDAVRKIITLTACLCFPMGMSAWRQWQYNIRQVRRLFREVRNLKRSSSKNEEKKAEKEAEIIEAHRRYADLALSFVEKAKTAIAVIRGAGPDFLTEAKLQEIEKYINHAERQIDQIVRRVIRGEKIPHGEKVFSIFEEHTEWISKGKAGVPQELGVRVCILEDQYGFILYHLVMEGLTDDRVAVRMAAEAQERFPELRICSFDKGFYSPKNKEELGKRLDGVILPKKGRLSEKEREEEHSEDFVKAKRRHSGVESAINALENHSLDRCPDHGIEGFKRYAALAVLARNIQILGNIIQQKKLKSRKRREKYNKTTERNRAAA